MGALFADRLGSIVAGGTVSGDTAMIKTRQAPVGGGMTIIALVIALDMIGRLARGPDIVVTTTAAYGRPHKDAADMAAVTINITMATRQGKAGGKVVITTIGSGK